jgi:hypothetical protein
MKTGHKPDKQDVRNRCVWGVQVNSYRQEVAYGPRDNHQFHVYAVHSSRSTAWKHIMDILEDRCKHTGLIIRRQPWDVRFQKLAGNINIQHYSWMLEYKTPHYEGPKRRKDLFVTEDISLYQWYVSKEEK